MTDHAPSVQTTISERVATVTLSNPGHRNAMTSDMWLAIVSTARKLREEKDVRVVILRGAGEEAFCSGADISEFSGQRHDSEQAQKYNALVQDSIDAIASLPVPVIAQVYGFCVGAGTAIAAACDMRYIADTVRFGVPAARLGIGYSPYWIRSLMQIVGKPITAEILLSAKLFDAKKALECGFANEILPAAELEDFTSKTAAALASNAPLTIAASKICLHQLSLFESERDWDSALRAARICEESRDYKEAVIAFANKQRPVFRGV